MLFNQKIPLNSCMIFLFEVQSFEELSLPECPQVGGVNTSQKVQKTFRKRIGDGRFVSRD